MRNLPYCPGASPAMRLGAMPQRDQESLSTSDSVTNLAWVPDFQHCPAIDNRTPYQTQLMEIPDRLKESRSPSWQPLNHKTRCIAMERSGSPQHQTMLPTWHRCQISNTVWENYWIPNRLKRISIKSQRPPAVRLGALPQKDQVALQHQTMLTTWHGRQIFHTVQSNYLECLTGWRNSRLSPHAP